MSGYIVDHGIVAFDLSLTSTGVAYSGGYGRIIPPSAMRGIPRLRHVRDCVLLHAGHREIPARLVVLEGYAFAATAAHAHELGELGGVVRLALADADIPFVDVPPSSLKLFASGKGNASKDQVLVDAVKKLGYSGSSKDEADALWLREMTYAAYGIGDWATRELAEYQQRATAKVPWPQLRSSMISTRIDPSLGPGEWRLEEAIDPTVIDNHYRILKS